MYSHTYSKSMDQPDKVANPARGELNRENEYSPVPVFVPENLVSRDGFGSPVPRQPAHLHTQAESGAYLRDSSQVPRDGFGSPVSCQPAHFQLCRLLKAWYWNFDIFGIQPTTYLIMYSTTLFLFAKGILVSLHGD